MTTLGENNKAHNDTNKIKVVKAGVKGTETNTETKDETNTETKTENEMCMICGDSLGEGCIETLQCGHNYHYMCIFKTFQICKRGHYSSHKNKCPYCRQSSGYLPLVNGLAKPIKHIHYDPAYPIPEYVPVRCTYILKRGKNKGNPCDCKCQVGMFVCKRHS